MLLKSLTKHKQLILYGCSLAVLLFILKWIEWRFVVIDYSLEVYITIIALIFTALGIWLALKLVKPKTIIVEKEVPITAVENVPCAETARLKLGLSQREAEVLHLMAQGLSNQEIADQLFVSLNTIKTHASKIFEKLEVKRRTQAVERGRQLGII